MGCGINTWWASHIDTASFGKFVRLGTEVHELIHCLHNNKGNFIPGVDFNKVAYNEKGLHSSSWRNSFPKRGEIYSQFTSKLQATSMFKLYFTNERHGIANQRLSGFLTECEAYLHGPNSGAWLNDGVSSGYSSTPTFTSDNRGNLDIQEGHPYNLAMWQVASVLYLKTIKNKYSTTW